MSHEYTLFVSSSPAEGREADFHDWYDNVHLAEFRALPGVLSGRRYTVMSAADGKPVFAAIYELSEDPNDVLAKMNEGIKAGTMHMTDAVDPASVRMTMLKAR